MTIRHVRDWLAINHKSPETLEGVRSFAEKRRPDYESLRRLAEDDRSPEYLHGAPMKTCPHCGAQNLPAHFTYCGECGGKL